MIDNKYSDWQNNNNFIVNIIIWLIIFFCVVVFNFLKSIDLEIEKIRSVEREKYVD